jgi:hypothetical protein
LPCSVWITTLQRPSKGVADDAMPIDVTAAAAATIAAKPNLRIEASRVESR